MKLCQGKDVFERMNYLYQASLFVATQTKNMVAASYYGNIMVGCAKKAVLRMGTDVKRTICKSCQSPLIPGKTARVRLVSKRKKMIKWTCLTCNNSKQFPTGKGYKLWTEQPEAQIDIFDYTTAKTDVVDNNRKPAESSDCAKSIAGNSSAAEKMSFDQISKEKSVDNSSSMDLSNER